MTSRRAVALAPTAASATTVRLMVPILAAILAPQAVAVFATSFRVETALVARHVDSLTREVTLALRLALKACATSFKAETAHVALRADSLTRVATILVPLLLERIRLRTLAVCTLLASAHVALRAATTTMSLSLDPARLLLTNLVLEVVAVLATPFNRALALEAPRADFLTTSPRLPATVTRNCAARSRLAAALVVLHAAIHTAMALMVATFSLHLLVALEVVAACAMPTKVATALVAAHVDFHTRMAVMPLLVARVAALASHSRRATATEAKAVGSHMNQNKRVLTDRVSSPKVN